MIARALLPLLVVAVLLLAAFSTGSAIFLGIGTLLLLVLFFAWISVVTAARTMTIACEMSSRRVRRGEDVRLQVVLQHHGLLPIAPVLVTLTAAPGEEAPELRLTDAAGKRQVVNMPYHAAHVGLTTPGIHTVTLEDVFGLFSITKSPAKEENELLVLPNLYKTEPIAFAPGDSGSEVMARATEDISNPSDFRAYQQGDALKKIHWKLSMRKNELIVRRFEEPILPEALLLMDCSPPPTWGHPEAAADVRDALLETAASVFLDQVHAGHQVRMPLTGRYPVEMEKASGEQQALEQLARLDFSETDRFERMLLLETRRLRKVGATIVISARLNGAMVDVMIRMHRMGPNMRLYLVTFYPEDPGLQPMLSQLKQAGIEVQCVIPKQA